MLLQVRVCAFPGSSFGLNNVAISPDLDPDFDISMRQVCSSHLFVLQLCWRRLPRVLISLVSRCLVFLSLLLQLLFWALEAPSEDIIDMLFNNGYRDAASWASTYSPPPSALPLPALQ